MPLRTRPEQPTDHDAIFAVVSAAFGRPDEARLVAALRAAGDVVLSFVADDNDQIVGHVLFTRLFIQTATQRLSALALAPLAVQPARQSTGIGTALTRAGLEQAASADERIVVVLGHERYYPRFGFSPELAEHIEAPFAGPSFMALELVPGALAGVHGRALYPRAFGLADEYSA